MIDEQSSASGHDYRLRLLSHRGWHHVCRIVATRNIVISKLPDLTGNIAYVLFTGYTYVVLRQTTLGHISYFTFS